MRLSDREFAAEVLRRSEEYRLSRRRRMIRITRGASVIAACLAVVIFAGFRFGGSKNYSNREDKLKPASDNAEQYDRNNSGRKGSNSPKSEQPMENAAPERTPDISLRTAETAYAIADDGTVTVTVENHAAEALTLRTTDFSLTQDGRIYRADPDETADAVTVQPHAEAELTLPVGKWLKGARGTFRLCCDANGGSQQLLTLTFTDAS